MKHSNMKSGMSHSAITLLTACLFILSPASALATDMYVGFEAGFVAQESVDINGTTNDVPTRCDQLLRSTATNDAIFVNLTQSSLAGECRRGQDSWDSGSDVDLGTLIGFQLGYRLASNWRAEFEYMHSTHSGGDIEDIDLGGGSDKAVEFVVAEQGLRGMSSDSFLANVFYDFEKMNEKFTPYIGFGIGFAEVDLEYSNKFTRNSDPGGLGGNSPPAAAGTTSDANDTLSDTVFVWQLMGGVDYEITEQWSVGLKARYMAFEDVEDSDDWDRLRGHDSAIATAEYARNNGGFDPAVEYDIEVEDITAWAVGANFKYRF